MLKWEFQTHFISHFKPQAIKSNLKEAQTSYWKVMKKGEDHHCTPFLMAKAEDIANETDNNPDNISTRLIPREKLHRAHRQVRLTINNLRS